MIHTLNNLKISVNNFSEFLEVSITFFGFSFFSRFGLSSFLFLLID